MEIYLPGLMWRFYSISKKKKIEKVPYHKYIILVNLWKSRQKKNCRFHRFSLYIFSDIEDQISINCGHPLYKVILRLLGIEWLFSSFYLRLTSDRILRDSVKSCRCSFNEVNFSNISLRVSILFPVVYYFNRYKFLFNKKKCSSMMAVCVCMSHSW